MAKPSACDWVKSAQPCEEEEVSREVCDDEDAVCMPWLPGSAVGDDVEKYNYIEPWEKHAQENGCILPDRFGQRRQRRNLLFGVVNDVNDELPTCEFKHYCEKRRDSDNCVSIL